jgi:hypothetical protein
LYFDVSKAELNLIKKICNTQPNELVFICKILINLILKAQAAGLCSYNRDSIRLFPKTAAHVLGMPSPSLGTQPIDVPNVRTVGWSECYVKFIYKLANTG